MSDLHPYREPPDFERLPLRIDGMVRGLIKPDGLEHAISFERDLEGVSLEQLQEACKRYAARKTTVPGSYANRHYIETGHAFGFGCCLGTER